jgi:hypothetical protein
MKNPNEELFEGQAVSPFSSFVSLDPEGKYVITEVVYVEFEDDVSEVCCKVESTDGSGDNKVSRLRY